jgi:hypothetical protein
VPADSGENLERQMLLSLSLMGPYACFFSFSKTSEVQFFCQKKTALDHPRKGYRKQANTIGRRHIVTIFLKSDLS